MVLANAEAHRFNHEDIGTEHQLLGLIKEGSGVAANVLKNLDVDLRRVRLEVEKIVQSGPEMVTIGKLPQTPRAKKVIEYAIETAREWGHNHVGTEHLLMGLLREQEGIACQVLLNLGIKLDDVKEGINNLLGKTFGEGEKKKTLNQQLNTMSRINAPGKRPLRAQLVAATSIIDECREALSKAENILMKLEKEIQELE